MNFRCGVLTMLLASAGVTAFSSVAFADAPVILAPSYADTAEEDLPVMARPRPEYDAKGIPLGGFRLFPDLNLTSAYDDNIYRTQTNKFNDFVFEIAPAVRVRSDWNRHMLEAYAGIENYEYATQTSENLTDWNAGADGRYDITGGASVYGNGSAAQLHEARSSPNQVGFQAAPNRYFQYHGETDATYQPNRFGLTAGAQVDSFIYQNTPTVGGGFLNNKDRNYSEYQGYAKAFYDFSPGYTGFLRASYDTRQFAQELDRTGVHRSSNGYKVDGGVDLQISHLLSGEVYLGYLKQDFSAPLKSVSGLDYAAKLDWLATPLLTVHLQGSRILTQVILAGASVSDDKSVGISADYEILRNVIAQAHANYVDSSYTGIARHDESPDLGLGVKYLINRYASVGVAYAYTERLTNVSGIKYKDNYVSIGLNLHL
jgi:hypothetical protein